MDADPRQTTIAVFFRLVLTVREPSAWYRSVATTLLPLVGQIDRSGMGEVFFRASVDFFIPMVTSSAFQVELVVALHVLGSLPEQLPDQTPGHSLQVEFDTFS